MLKDRLYWMSGRLRLGHCLFLGLELDRDLLDLSAEGEGQRVSEVHRRADIHADVQSLTEGELDRNAAGQPALCDLLAVSGHGESPALAHAAAVIGKVDDQRRLALRQRALRRDSRPF